MTTQRIWRIGLTGGIGSGKSTVAQQLSELGAAVIDADAISRSLTAPGGLAIEQIARIFGSHMIRPAGALDRQAMRDLVFNNAPAKKQLEDIIHPLVSRLTQEQDQAAIDQGFSVLVFDVPLLVESGERWRRKVDRVIVVDCDADTQRQRVMARSGLNADEIDRIMAQQAPRFARLACADTVICNQGLSLDDLALKVRQIAHHFGL